MNAPRKLNNMWQAFRIMILAVIVLLLPNASLAEDWQFELEPYAFASSIEGDASVGRIVGAPVKLGFDDILENLEMAAMLHFEAHHNSGWGFAFDYGFMDLGADIATPRGGLIDVGVRQGVLEALAIKRTVSSGKTLDYFLGLRWWDNDLEIAFDPAILPGTASVDVTESWVDVVAGVRFRQILKQGLQLQMSADVGAGGADFTSSVSAGLFYDLSPQWSLDFRYKATWVDFQEGSSGKADYFSYNTVTHGPLVGFIYKF